MKARRAELRGVVQGVGFRPFVARLARRLGLRGSVGNRGGVVVLEVEGDDQALERFAAALTSEAPPAARIDAIAWTEIPALGREEFEICASESVDDGALAIGPDLRVCDECLAELERADDRRFGYALDGCTNCGPRFCIATRSPWQRDNSSMAEFNPCPACMREFADPTDRRFHAEAIACPRCGPNLRLEDRCGRLLADSHEAITAAVELLLRGGIVALQGVGGFQLLTDARDPAAVARLRERKRRPAKPLALMVATLAQAETLAQLEPLEREALCSPAGPIVLVRRRLDAQLAEAVAPGSPRLGLMLATTPAHALVLERFGGLLVATSGNVHGRPIATTLAEARAQLGEVADALLVHDRAIQRRCDDSVTQVVAGRLRVLRLGRGFAPARITLPSRFAELPPMLALGANLAHAPVLLRDGIAHAWPHVGDLDEPHTRAAMRESIADMARMLGEPTLLAIDAHPDYASSLWARAQAERRWVAVLHHHAHVAAVLAEHGRERGLGVAWDGTGLGADRTIWGGEFLRVDPSRARRVAHLRSFPLLGGDAAARDGLRSLAGMLAAAELDAPDSDRELQRLIALSRNPKLTTPTSSVGRMFDAVAALTGVCRRSRYQAEAAQRLEHLAAPGAEPYPFSLRAGLLDWRAMLAAMLAERSNPSLVASRFHATLTAMILAVAGAERASTVVLAGGCFANRVLLEAALEALRSAGIEALAARRLPPGDGGLALGQAWVAGHRLLAEVR